MTNLLNVSGLGDANSLSTQRSGLVTGAAGGGAGMIIAGIGESIGLHSPIGQFLVTFAPPLSVGCTAMLTYLSARRDARQKRERIKKFRAQIKSLQNDPQTPRHWQEGLERARREAELKNISELAASIGITIEIAKDSTAKTARNEEDAESGSHLH